jgi:pSer/pThr/pTyr-binding forkhead associated (FHA) protein/ribosomal protein L40E
MIVCPNCNHQNPDGATQCEACYTPLPTTTTCPNCGATVQEDASFCGQCGFNLKASAPVGAGMSSAPNSSLPEIPDLISPDPLIEPEPMSMNSQQPDVEPNYTSPPNPDPASPLPATVVGQPMNVEEENPDVPEPETMPPPPPPTTSQSPASAQEATSPPTHPVAGSANTQLQIQAASLLHVQTNNKIELPLNLSVIHIGKPNDQIPPDIDVSGFPNSEIVSRIHADIRVEGDTYFIEDVGSSNGTYINHSPLPKGNRHRLRTGDRISLGKGDQVTFLFQSS